LRRLSVSNLRALISFQVNVGVPVISMRFFGNTCLKGEYIDIKLTTRKSSQTGVLHSWRLYANDVDEVMCPLRALIRVAMLYGDTTKLSGPLFLRVNNQGAVMQEPVVSESPPVPLSFFILADFGADK
jgi:hypothetical protein